MTPNKALNNLKTSLAARHDNTHLIGGGGNTAELFYTMTRAIEAVSTEQEQPSFDVGVPGAEQIVFKVPATFSLKDARQALTTFVGTRSDFNAGITEQQLSSVDFLREHAKGSDEIAMMLRAVETAKDCVATM